MLLPLAFSRLRRPPCHPPACAALLLQVATPATTNKSEDDLHVERMRSLRDRSSSASGVNSGGTAANPNRSAGSSSNASNGDASHDGREETVEELRESFNSGTPSVRRKRELIKRIDRKRHHCEDDLRELDSMRKSLSVEVARAELVRRPWVEQFKAALDGEGQDSRESGSGGGRLGLPPALVEAAFGRRQAAKRDGGQLAEATAAAMEMLCGALRAMEELDVHRLLHILKCTKQLKVGIEECEVEGFDCSPFKKPLDRILSKIFFYLDSVSDWRKLTSAEASIVTESVNEMEMVPQMVKSILSCFLNTTV